MILKVKYLKRDDVTGEVYPGSCTISLEAVTMYCDKGCETDCHLSNGEVLRIIEPTFEDFDMVMKTSFAFRTVEHAREITRINNAK